ncbi:MAG: 16S rRNA (cytosine(1402)-N(4))-methyltransferase RsmH [Bacteroidetes bacterium]|nr:16S rRNA (cytosine(1402)-N(4))-methyltransferase RsmH [Bacteroidota bacterium]MBS1630957.1 16S rRNA (cytosine(1402)-N(4))-methyltransferase RsmH [Bacteroidota bacterium]
MVQPYHTPVLLKETVDGLKVKPGGIYVDCTFGGGGHSKAILERIGNRGRLVAFDQDQDAQKNLPADSRIIFIPQNFRHLQRFLRLHQVAAVDGILADLGVSSHQLNEGKRGFSTRFNAEMDMRMDQHQKLTALEVVNTYTEPKLHKLFEQYGEVTNAKTLAKTIVSTRQSRPLKTTDEFQNALRSVVKGNPERYFAQVFQALRIEVNDELGALKEMLLQVADVLKPGGRIVVITFHSLEDRLVKNFFRHESFDVAEQNPFINVERVNKLKRITKKPITASEEEVRSNSRARSAKLRIAEKI